MERNFLSTNVPSRYVVRWSTFASGESMPFLLSMATGLPLEGPTYWALADRRAKNVAANTIRNDLHDLIYLYLFCDLRGIDLLERLEEGVFFTQAEIVDLARLAGRYYSDLVQEIESNVINLGAVKRRVAPRCACPLPTWCATPVR